MRHTLLVLLLLTWACGDACSRKTQLGKVDAQVSVPAEVQLGRPFVGDRVEVTFPITAISSGAVRVLNVTTSHPELSLQWRQGDEVVTLSRGATLDVKVLWIPAAEGPLDASIEVELDLEEAPRQIVKAIGEARLMPSCDDGNQCTDDVFDRKTETCRWTNHDRACDDHNACTDDDRCQAGQCKGVGITCDDDNVCTSNFCDPAMGCVFPPDGRQCDDQDPCTTDLCDPDDGCSHENATGPACGPFSCSTAHICVVGECRELDITGSSDGFPCSDGDVCTDGDQCLAGKCDPGPRRNGGPTIVARLDTYGGEYGFAATDGFRYAFVDRAYVVNDDRSFRMAVPDGDGLRPAGALPLSATASPVAVGPGLFLVPLSGELTLVDATNPDQPVDKGVFPVNLGANGVTVQELFAVNGGVLVWGRFIGGMGRSTQDWLLFATVSPSTGAMGPWTLVFATDRMSDVDASEGSVVVSGASGVVWLHLDPNGTVTSSVVVEPLNNMVNKVSVHQNVAALQYQNRIRLLWVENTARHPVTCTAGTAECHRIEPGCDGTFPYPSGTFVSCASSGAGCPTGSICEMVSVQVDDPTAGVCAGICCEERVGVCMTASQSWWRELGWVNAERLFDLQLLAASSFNSPLTLYWSTGTGLYAAPIDRIMQQGNVVQGPQDHVDGIASANLGRGSDHLLAAARAVLPFKLQWDTQTQKTRFQRMVGPGQGDVRAIVDATPDRLALGGLMSVGELDLTKQQFANWKLTETASNYDLPRLLQGTTQIAPIEDNFIMTFDIQGPTPSPCGRTLVNFTDVTGAWSLITPCHLFDGKLAATPGRLWAVTDPTLAGNPPDFEMALRQWNLNPYSDQPAFEKLDAKHHATRDLRASADGSHLALLEMDFTQGLRLFLLKADQTPSPFAGEFVLEATGGSAPQIRYHYNTDGQAALTVVDGVVRLHPMVPITPTRAVSMTPLPAQTLPDARPKTMGNVLSMKNGQAWVGWQSNAITYPAYRISELTYDVQGNVLTNEGTVDLSAPAHAVATLGDYTVAASRAEVVVIAPSCR
jgi:hypothetical protein